MSGEGQARALAGRHLNVHFHFSPSYAGWLNQVEIYFPILAASGLKGSSFTSPTQLKSAIDDFVAAYRLQQHSTTFRSDRGRGPPKTTQTPVSAIHDSGC